MLLVAKKLVTKAFQVPPLSAKILNQYFCIQPISSDVRVFFTNMDVRHCLPVLSTQPGVIFISELSPVTFSEK